MKFVHPATGADVGEDQIDTHLYRFLAAEDGDRLDLFRTAQPKAGGSLAQLLLNAGSLEGVLNRTTFNFKEQMTFT